MLGFLPERAAVARELAGVESQLERARTREDKVAILVRAINELQARRGHRVLQLSSGTGGGDDVMRDHHILSMAVAMMMTLARKHGVYEQFGAALEHQKLAEIEGVWGSGPEGAPLAALGCANIDIAASRVCPRPATAACSRCGLVAYCSRECQKQHWAAHKHDCKSSKASDDWVPEYIRERRQPGFIGGDPGSSFIARLVSNAQPRQHLWGNTPAFCLVPKPAGSARGAGSTSTDGAGPGSAGDGASAHAAASGSGSPLSLPVSHICFAASGDLRNVIATMNGLDAGHAGKVVIHVNDADPTIMARNLVLLLLLAQGGPAAVDAAIATWYSTAVTAAQRMNTMQAVTRLLGLAGGGRGGMQPMAAKLLRPDGSEAAVTLDDLLGGRASGPVKIEPQQLSSRGAEAQGAEGAGGSACGGSDPSAGAGSGAGSRACSPRASLVVDFEPHVWAALMAMAANQASLQELMHSRAEAVQEQAQLDKRDRYIQHMEPYHRVSWCELYDQGMLLPFGALNAHHNAPNTFLFHPHYGYLLGAGCDPLQGWPLGEVMAAGRRHRLPPNDLYGALFFHLREQLGEFAGRLAGMDLELRLTAQLAQDLAPQLREEGVLFDFIDTSNIADPNYVGIKRVLQDWGPLLNAGNPEATLVTLFMNWLADMPDLDPSLGVPKRQVRRLLREAAQSMPRELPAALQADMAALRLGEGPAGSGQPSDGAAAAVMGMTEQAMERAKERQDYGPALDRYLDRQGVPAAAAAAGVRRRARHRIVPRRFFTPVGAPPGALPFQGWAVRDAYLARRFAGLTLLEQYVEWEVGST